MSKLQKRVHSDLIKAWAEGYDIQVLTSKGWLDIVDPRWDDACEYRIKDEYTYLREAIKAGKKVYFKHTNSNITQLCTAYDKYQYDKESIEYSFLSTVGGPECYIIEELIKYEPFDSIEDLKIVLGRTVKSADSVGVITGGFLGVNGERTKNVMYFYTGDSSHPITAEDLLNTYTFVDESPCGKLVK